MLYWFAKEELANCKFVHLLQLTEELGVSDIKLFQHRSSGSVREMFLLLGKMIKEHVVKRVLKSNCSSLLCDEVCYISCEEQLITFTKFVDPTGRVITGFLALDDVLDDFHSGNTEAIKSVAIKLLEESILDVKKLTGLGFDGASVWTGEQIGFASLHVLQK